jgi:hypothetical protein
MIRRSKSKRAKSLQKEVAPLIRENTATLYGLYFATSNTDFLLNEKKTRFSVRPDVILKQDRQTTIFDYSSIKGSEQASIFDGFFRGLQEGTTCAAGVTGCSGATCCGSTLGLAGAIRTTCNFINDVTGIPNTDFADTYTLSKVDVTSKTIVAIKETPITTTTAVQFNSDYFIDLPQWTKTQKNQISTPVKKIINLLSSQSLGYLGIRTGSVLEFKKTKNNNSRFTVVDIYNENGFEVIEVDEEITKEDLTESKVIVSVYGEEKSNQKNNINNITEKEYANRLTEEFYYSLNNPKKPSGIRRIDLDEGPPVIPAPPRPPSSTGPCNGKCIQSKTTSFSMDMCFVKENGCTKATVQTFYNQSEQSECLSEQESKDRGYDTLLPIREFDMDITNTTDDCIRFSGEAFIMTNTGTCNVCKDTLCVSSFSEQTSDTYGSCKTTPDRFGAVSSAIQDTTLDGINTAWLFRDSMMKSISRHSLFMFEQQDCSCSDLNYPSFPVFS